MLRSLAIAAMLVALPAIAAALTLTLDQDTYIVGDVIQITIDNTGGPTLQTGGAPPFGIQRLDGPYDGMAHVPVIVTLEADEILVETWDTGMLPDPAGEYGIGTSWWVVDDPDQTMSDSATYTLEDVVPIEATTWSAVHRLFR